MKKSRAALSPYQQHKMMWTARFGYVMFAAVVINAIVSIISLADLTTYTKAGGGSVLPQFFWFIGISVLASVIPPVVAYLVGGRGATTNSVHEHHYNGVLFALLTGWIALSLNFMPWTDHTMFYIPAFIAAMSLFITLLIALGYGRHTKPVPLQQYLPYRFALIAAFILIVIESISLFLGQIVPLAKSSEVIVVLANILGTGFALWLGYKASREHDRWSRCIDSLIAVSIGAWTTNLFSLFLAGVYVTSFIEAVPLLIGLLAWASYLYLIHFYAPLASKTTHRRSKTSR